MGRSNLALCEISHKTSKLETTHFKLTSHKLKMTLEETVAVEQPQEEVEGLVAPDVAGKKKAAKKAKKSKKKARKARRPRSPRRPRKPPRGPRPPRGSRPRRLRRPPRSPPRRSSRGPRGSLGRAESKH